MRIYLTRHGETEWNTLGKMQGWKNSNLTEKGIEDAIKLGERLSDTNIDIVYTSPLGRAVETSKHIIGARDIAIVKKDYLKEMNFGKWEGICHKEVKERWPINQDYLWNYPEKYMSMGGETVKEFRDRINYALIDIINNSEAENILVVAHALVVKAFYNVINNKSIKEMWDCPFIGNTSLTIIEVNDGQPVITMEADTSHLELQSI